MLQPLPQITIAVTLVPLVPSSVSLPEQWTGLWYSSKAGDEVSITADYFGSVIEPLRDLSISGKQLLYASQSCSVLY